MKTLERTPLNSVRMMAPFGIYHGDEMKNKVDEVGGGPSNHQTKKRAVGYSNLEIYWRLPNLEAGLFEF